MSRYSPLTAVAPSTLLLAVLTVVALLPAPSIAYNVCEYQMPESTNSTNENSLYMEATSPTCCSGMSTCKGLVYGPWYTQPGAVVTNKIEGWLGWRFTGWSLMRLPAEPLRGSFNATISFFLRFNKAGKRMTTVISDMTDKSRFFISVDPNAALQINGEGFSLRQHDLRTSQYCLNKWCFLAFQRECPSTDPSVSCKLSIWINGVRQTEVTSVGGQLNTKNINVGYPLETNSPHVLQPTTQTIPTGSGFVGDISYLRITGGSGLEDVAALWADYNKKGIRNEYYAGDMPTDFASTRGGSAFWGLPSWPTMDTYYPTGTRPGRRLYGYHLRLMSLETVGMLANLETEHQYPFTVGPFPNALATKVYSGILLGSQKSSTTSHYSKIFLPFMGPSRVGNGVVIGTYLFWAKLSGLNNVGRRISAYEAGESCPLLTNASSPEVYFPCTLGGQPTHALGSVISAEECDGKWCYFTLSCSPTTGRCFFMVNGRVTATYDSGADHGGGILNCTLQSTLACGAHQATFELTQIQGYPTYGMTEAEAADAFTAASGRAIQTQSRGSPSESNTGEVIGAVVVVLLLIFVPAIAYFFVKRFRSGKARRSAIPPVNTYGSNGGPGTPTGGYDSIQHDDGGQRIRQGADTI